MQTISFGANLKHSSESETTTLKLQVIFIRAHTRKYVCTQIPMHSCKFSLYQIMHFENIPLHIYCFKYFPNNQYINFYCLKQILLLYVFLKNAQLFTTTIIGFGKRPAITGRGIIKYIDRYISTQPVHVDFLNKQMENQSRQNLNCQWTPYSVCKQFSQPTT